MLSWLARKRTNIGAQNDDDDDHVVEEASQESVDATILVSPGSSGDETEETSTLNDTIPESVDNVEVALTNKENAKKDSALTSETEKNGNAALLTRHNDPDNDLENTDIENTDLDNADLDTKEDKTTENNEVKNEKNNEKQLDPPLHSQKSSGRSDNGLVDLDDDLDERECLTPIEVKYAIERALREEARGVRRKHLEERKRKEAENERIISVEEEGVEVDGGFVFQDQDKLNSCLTVQTTKPNAIHELCLTLQSYPQQGLPLEKAFELLPKVQDYHIARYHRNRLYRTQPWGVMGLFLYIADLKMDLEWVETTAWCRLQRQKGQDVPLPASWPEFEKQHKYNAARRTYFVYVMHFISVLLMAVAFGLNGWKAEPMNENPLFGPSADVLLKMGALNADAVIDDNEWFRLLSPLFLHAGLIHLAINMLALQFIGGAVERIYGTLGTTVIFVGSGVGGNIASVLLGIPGSVSVGASGGLFGLLGLCLGSIATNWDLITLKNYYDKSDKGFPYRKVLFVLAIEIVVNMVIGLTPFIDNFAHLGGLLYGGLLGVPLLTFGRIRLFGCRQIGHFTTTRKCNTCFAFLLRSVSFLMGMGLMIWSSYALASHDGGESLCYSCRFITCAPFPFWEGADPWWHCDSCHLTTGTYVRHSTTTILTMTCPEVMSGDTDPIVIDLHDPSITHEAISESLAGFCRESCPN